TLEQCDHVDRSALRHAVTREARSASLAPTRSPIAMAPTTNTDLKESARVAAASAGSAAVPAADRRIAPAMLWYMTTPGIIGTAPANASAENGRCMRMAAVLAIRPMARHPNSVEIAIPR